VPDKARLPLRRQTGQGGQTGREGRAIVWPGPSLRRPGAAPRGFAKLSPGHTPSPSTPRGFAKLGPGHARRAGSG
jgi:hypothetical protein